MVTSVVVRIPSGPSNSTQNSSKIVNNAGKAVVDVISDGVNGIAAANVAKSTIPFSSTNIGDIFYKTPNSLANVSIKTLRALGRYLIGVGWVLEVAPAQVENYKEYGFPNYSPEAQGQFWGDLWADTIIYTGSFTAGVVGAGFVGLLSSGTGPVAFGTGVAAAVGASTVTEMYLNQTNIRQSWVDYFTDQAASPQPYQGSFMNWDSENYRSF